MSDDYPTSNTYDCFKSMIGHKIVGYIPNDTSHIIVMDDGRGLGIDPNGTNIFYWILSPAEIKNLISSTINKLQEIIDHHEEMIRLAEVFNEITKKS